MVTVTRLVGMPSRGSGIASGRLPVVATVDYTMQVAASLSACIRVPNCGCCPAWQHDSHRSHMTATVHSNLTIPLIWGGSKLHVDMSATTREALPTGGELIGGIAVPADTLNVILTPYAASCLWLFCVPVARIPQRWALQGH